MATSALTQADFRALFEQSPHPYLVLSPDPGFTILGANDAYLEATKTQRESLIGRSLFEAFPDNPDEPGATGVANLRDSLLRVLERKAPDTMPIQKYGVRRPASEGGAYETRYWTPHNTPVLTPDGEVSCIIHNVEDATAFMIPHGRDADQEESNRELVQRDALHVRREAERDRRDIARDEMDRERDADTARVGRARDHAEALAQERAALLAETRRHADERGYLLAESGRKAAELEAVINSIPDAVYIGDATGIKRANQAALDLLGYETVEELNQNVATLAQQIQTRSYETRRQLPVEEQVFTRALQGEAARMEVVTRHLKTGNDVVVRSSAAPVVVDGHVVGAVAINVDITDHIRRAEELRARSDFERHLIGIVSHDLKSPLTAIIVGCQTVLRRDGLDERQRKSTLRMLAAAERAGRMTSDLLDFTKARLGGGIPIRRSDLNLHGLVSRTVEEVQAGYGEREIILEQHGDGHGEWDADRVVQVLTNLLRNAVAYSPADTPVRVVTAGDDNAVTLGVHNLGDPIPADKRLDLFEPMQRATEVGTEGRSVGLGLYIVQAIVKAHGGTVSVESTREHGTTFTVRLPRRGA